LVIKKQKNAFYIKELYLGLFYTKNSAGRIQVMFFTETLDVIKMWLFQNVG